MFSYIVEIHENIITDSTFELSAVRFDELWFWYIKKCNFESEGPMIFVHVGPKFDRVVVKFVAIYAQHRFIVDAERVRGGVPNEGLGVGTRWVLTLR